MVFGRKKKRSYDADGSTSAALAATTASVPYGGYSYSGYDSGSSCSSYDSGSSSSCDAGSF